MQHKNLENVLHVKKSKSMLKLKNKKKVLISNISGFSTFDQIYKIYIQWRTVIEKMKGCFVVNINIIDLWNVYYILLPI